MSATSPSFRAIAVCGCGHDGRLGLGQPRKTHQLMSTHQATLIPNFLPPSSSSSSSPSTTCSADDEVLAIYCGGYHTLARTSSGIYGWGSNEHGQLGIGRPSAPGGADALHEPKRITFFDDAWKAYNQTHKGGEVAMSSFIQSIHCGCDHSLVRTLDALYACGRNDAGQLGLGHDEAAVYDWQLLCTLPIQLIEEMNPTSSSSSSVARTLLAGVGACLRRGELIAVSAGTHHTLLAFRNALMLQDGADPSGPPRLRFLPNVLLACGRGDFGELGYDGEAYDVMRARDRRVQNAIVAEATTAQLTGASSPTTTSASASAFGATNSNPYAAKWAAKRKQRRPDFFSTNFRPVVCDVLDHGAADLAWADNLDEVEVEVQAAIAAVDGDEVWDVVELSAMHLHSAVLLRGRRSGNHRTLHWGCYYNNEVEDLQSSIPRPLDDDDDDDDGSSPRVLHAAHERMMIYQPTPTSPTPAPVRIMGSGVLGLGDEDSFEPHWVNLHWEKHLPEMNMMKVAHTHAPVVRSIAGRDHTLLLVCHDDGDVVLGFGDNLHGQLGCNDADMVDQPRCVLQRGAVLLAPNDGRTWEVQRIVQAGAGARHSVFLVDVCVATE